MKKKIEVYEQILKENRLPVTKGHTQTEEDQLIRKVILDLICRGKAEIPFIIWEKLPLENLNVLFEMEKEGLIFRDQRRIEVTTDGMAVVRNICALFDMRMVASKSQKVTFSKSI
ncbi:hypothetical protein [Algoriphagus boritolerans]|uniref:hypothetical protein n=1 Tax=Algoriphagus boritolerans TaxID=308111 RepID=UPI002FCE3F11